MKTIKLYGCEAYGKNGYIEVCPGNTKSVIMILTEKDINITGIDENRLKGIQISCLLIPERFKYDNYSSVIDSVKLRMIDQFNIIFY